MNNYKKVYVSPFVQVFKIDRYVNIVIDTSIGGGDSGGGRDGDGYNRYIPRNGNNESQIYHNPFLENKFKENPFGPSY